jgi:hypothetical protein
MITIRIPNKGNMINLDKELSLAQNIKSQENRKTTLAGLRAVRVWV